MPRDSSGNYSLPVGTLVNSGDTILTSQHNPFATDVAAALTSSVDRGGLGGMLATLNMSNNRIANLADGVNPTDAATVRQVQGAASVPVGAVIDFWGSDAPQGYLLCYGQEVSRTTYSDLFAVIGTSAGAGNGTSTFNVPDYRGRVSAGRDNMGGASAARLNSIPSSTVGGTGGSQTHTLTEDEIPAHTHTLDDPGHTHTVGGSASQNIEVGPASVSVNYPITQNTGSATTGITVEESGGGGQPHANVQPTIICNKIIRAL